MAFYLQPQSLEQLPQFHAAQVQDPLLGKIWRAFVGCRVVRLGTQSIPDAAYTALSFDTAIHNVGGCWSLVQPTRLIAPRAGYYRAGGGWSRGASQNLTASRHIVAVRANGTTYLAATEVHTIANTGVYVAIATDAFYLAQGGYVEIVAYHNDGAARLTGGASVTSHRDCFGYLRGPL